MNYIEKHLNLSKNLNKLLNEEISKNGKNNLNNLLNNGYFLKKNILTEAALEPVEGLLIKYRNFYYKYIAKKIYDLKSSSSRFSEVKIYNHSNTLQNPNYYFILSYKTGDTGSYSADTIVMLYNLPKQRFFYYNYDNSSVEKWKKPITGYTSLDRGSPREYAFYQNAINELVTSAQTTEVNFGGNKFTMVNQTSSTDWSISFLASKIFEGFDEYSKSLLSPMGKAIKKQ